MSHASDFYLAWRRSTEYLVGEANGAYKFLEDFRSAGFSAFDPGIAFVERFAESDSELSLHRACQVEWIKEQTSSLDLGTPAYHSALLQEMRARRDVENGVPRERLRDVYGAEWLWREKYEPCARRMYRFALDQPDAWESQENRARQERQERVEIEADQCANLSKAVSFPKDERWPLYAELMRKYAGPLGFSQRSRDVSKPVVFGKTMARGLELRLSVQNSHTFKWDCFRWNFDLALKIIQKRTASTKERTTRLEYKLLVPGFVPGYGFFSRPEELELAVNVHMRLYSLIAAGLEAAIREH